jgi:hypothetical protein
MSKPTTDSQPVYRITLGANGLPHEWWTPS